MPSFDFSKAVSPSPAPMSDANAAKMRELYPDEAPALKFDFAKAKPPTFNFAAAKTPDGRSFMESLKERAGESAKDIISPLGDRQPTVPIKGESGGDFVRRAATKDIPEGIAAPFKILGGIGGVLASPGGAAGETLERKAALAAGVPPDKAEKLARDTGDITGMATVAALPGGKAPLAKDTIASAAKREGAEIKTGAKHAVIPGSGEEGFVTKSDKFLTRAEAEPVAKAADQLVQPEKTPGVLHSEDIGQPAPKSQIFSDDQPVASTQPISTVKGVADKLYQSRGAIRADYKEFSKWAQPFKGVPESFWQKALDHLDDPKGTPLSPQEKVVFDRSVGVMRNEIEKNRKEIKSAGLNPNMLEDESGSLGGAIRQRKGMDTPMDKLTGEKTVPRAPEGGRSLSRSAGTFKSRNMMALEKDGARQIVHIDDQGNIFDAGKRGDPIGRIESDSGEPVLNDGSKAKLGEATRKEVENATGGEIKYHDNAFGVYATTLLQTRRALRSARILQDIKKSPDFNMVAHGPFSKGEIPKGWREIPDSPEFRGWRFDPRYAEEIEDFIKGARRDSGTLNMLDKVNRFTLNLLFWANPIHAYNITDAFLATKGAGGLLKDLPGTTSDLLKSVKSIATRDKMAMEQARAGVPMPGLDTAGDEFRRMTMDVMGVKARQDPASFGRFIKEFGFNTPAEFFNRIGEVSHKAVFSWQDVLQQTLERGLIRQGLSRAQATEQIAKTFMDYRTPARVMDQRWIGQALRNQAWLDFPKYSYGRIKGLYNMAKGTAKGDAHAIDQLLMIAALYEFGQYAMNPLIQKFTGNPTAEAGNFGYTVAPDLIAKMAEGKRTPGQVLQSLASPGYALQAIDLARGVNPYLGKPISIPGESVKEIGFDYANELANKISPMQRFNQVESGRLTPEDIWLEQLGVKFPSDLPKSVTKQLKAREKYGNALQNELGQ